MITLNCLDENLHVDQWWREVCLMRAMFLKRPVYEKHVFVKFLAHRSNIDLWVGAWHLFKTRAQCCPKAPRAHWPEIDFWEMFTTCSNYARDAVVELFIWETVFFANFPAHRPNVRHLFKPLTQNSPGTMRTENSVFIKSRVHRRNLSFPMLLIAGRTYT